MTKHDIGKLMSTIEDLYTRIDFLEAKINSRSVEDVTNTSNIDNNIKLQNQFDALYDSIDEINKDIKIMKNNYTIEPFIKMKENFISLDDVDNISNRIKLDINTYINNIVNDAINQINDYHNRTKESLIDKINQFITKDESKEYVTRDELSILKEKIIDEYAYTHTRINNNKENISKKLDKSTAMEHLDDVRTHVVNSLDLNEYIKKSELKNILQDYQPQLDSILSEEDVNIRIKDIESKLDKYIYRDEVIDLLNTNKIDTNKSQVTYTADEIDKKLNLLVPYNTFIKGLENIYDKDAISDLLNKYVDRVDLQNNINILRDLITEYKTTIEKYKEDLFEYKKEIVDMNVVEYDIKKRIKGFREENNNIRQNLIKDYKDVVNESLNLKVGEFNVEIKNILERLTYVEGKIRETITKDDLKLLTINNR